MSLESLHLLFEGVAVLALVVAMVATPENRAWWRRER